MDEDCRIRAARSADLPGVVALEEAVFPDPWSADQFRVHLHDTFLVAVLPDAAVAGYLVARTALPEAEILNVAVAPGSRGLGVGGALLRSALRLLGSAGARTVFLEVRVSNRAAQRLYQRAGFQEAGRRQAYYRRPTEDALILVRAVSPPDGAE